MLNRKFHPFPQRNIFVQQGGIFLVPRVVHKIFGRFIVAFADVREVAFRQAEGFQRLFRLLRCGQIALKHRKVVRGGGMYRIVRLPACNQAAHAHQARNQHTRRMKRTFCPSGAAMHGAQHNRQHRRGQQRHHLRHGTQHQLRREKHQQRPLNAASLFPAQAINRRAEEKKQICHGSADRIQAVQIADDSGIRQRKRQSERRKNRRRARPPRQPVRQQIRAPAHQQRIHDRQITRAETQTERVCRQPDERNRRADGGSGRKQQRGIRRVLIGEVLHALPGRDALFRIAQRKPFRRRSIAAVRHHPDGRRRKQRPQNRRYGQQCRRQSGQPRPSCLFHAQDSSLSICVRIGCCPSQGRKAPLRPCQTARRP